MLYFRHEKMRDAQREFIKDIIGSVNERKVLLAHAETGLGKTDAAISGTLSKALDEDLTIFFLTPKISQHKIAAMVIRGIEKKYNLGLRGVDIIGRRYACIHPDINHLGHDSFYYACEKKRREETCEYYKRATGYSKEQQEMADNLMKKIYKDYGTIKEHIEIIKLGERYDACPYEIMKRFLRIARVVIADYYHLMIPSIRDIILKKGNKDIDRSIIIVDEAHNLAHRVRSYLSSTISTSIVKNAEIELRDVGIEDVELFDPFIKWLAPKIKEDGEMLSNKDAFLEYIESISTNIDDLRTLLITAGNEFIDKRGRKSNLLRMAMFIDKWMDDSEGVIHVIRRKGKYLAYSKKYLDPSYATSILNDAYASILMSGTLLPLEMHRDVLGIKPIKSILRAYPSPFKPENTIRLLSRKFSTRYAERTPENFKAIAEEIDRIIDASVPGVAVFFPSYNVLNAMVPFIKSKPLLVQKEKSTPKEIHNLIRRFRKGGILCAVQGGSLAEGIDYNNGEIKTAIIVGVALEEPSIEIRSMIDYYNKKFGKGWEYAYLFPAISKAIQAAGRGQRKETDRIAIVYIDSRFAWRKYKDTLSYGGKRFIITDNPALYVKQFWREA